MGVFQKKEGAVKPFPSLTNNRFTGESYTTKQRYKNYVPLDYMKAVIVDFDITKIVKSELLNFTQSINPETGEVLERLRKDGQPKSNLLTANFKNLLFEYYPDSQRLTISGSLHVFSNDGKHNHNDFDINAFLDVLSDFYNLFGISPQHLHLTQLEWGVNISPPIRSNDIIDHCLLHGRKPFEAKYDSFEGCYRQVKYRKRYFVKLYNKGLHYKLPYEILRFERKQIAYWFHCNKYRIGQTMQDLIHSNFKGLRETLLKDWNDLLMFDPLMNSVEVKLFKYRDPLFWNQSNFKDRFERKYHVDRLNLANKTHGQNIKGQIRELIIQKLNELNDENLTLYPFSYSGKLLESNNQNKVIAFINYPILSTHYGLTG